MATPLAFRSLHLAVTTVVALGCGVFYFFDRLFGKECALQRTLFSLTSFENNNCSRTWVGVIFAAVFTYSITS
jgi:hypothetical protein